MSHAAELRTAARRTPDRALAALLTVLAHAAEHPSDAAVGLLATVLHPALVLARQIRDTTPEETGLPDTAPTTPADELRAAAERARRVADPVYLAFARLLDGYATDWEYCPADHPGTMLDEHALAVARLVLGTTDQQPCASQSLPTYSGEVMTCVLAEGHSGQCRSEHKHPPRVSWPNPSHGVWNTDQQPETTSPAPLASGLPLVKGRCPACGTTGLFLGDGGYVTCSLIGCPEPDAASSVLERVPVDRAAVLNEAALELGRDLLRGGLPSFLDRLVGPQNAVRILRDVSTDRAAVLREAADPLDQRAAVLRQLSSSSFGEEEFAARELTEAADRLRRMADEAQQPETETHEHTWVTALDGDDEPARDETGRTWTHCGVCGQKKPAADQPDTETEERR